MKKFNVLVFPGGTEIGLEIHRALHLCKNIRLFSAGGKNSSHAPLVYARHISVPGINEPGWIDVLNKIIIDNCIDYIFPGYDDMIVALASNQDRLKAKTVSSPLETCLITRSKSETYLLLNRFLPTPHIFKDADSIKQFPVFVKPDKGHGSKDICIVTDRDRLFDVLREKKGLIITEYLPGEEYTVDCFSDREAGLLFCSGRIRNKIRNGISICSSIAQDQTVFVDYAKTISSRLKLHGAWFFQVKKSTDGVFKLLEIAPRIACTMALHRVIGINFPLLSIYEQERIPVSLLSNDVFVEINRALVNRYQHRIKFSTVYACLDDTILLNGNVNVMIIAFLYRCLQEKKKIVLLTRQSKDIMGTLEKYRLTSLWDDIIYLNNETSNTNYIKEPDAILIDNSFKERKMASERFGIYTFDCSMVEMLLDERDLT